MKFYVTTPIYYVNDIPHIGHAYTTVIADVLTRYHRMFGEESYFLTGVDEHGQKVQKAAEARGKDPQTHCDEMVLNFQNVWKELTIAPDVFMRTTFPYHKKVVQDCLQQLFDCGDIYIKEYEGWYSVSEEIFYTEKDLVNGKSPAGKEVTLVKEKNYFFKMSKYQDRLLKYIHDNPEFIAPENKKNETLGFLSKPLEDLCISRPKSRLSWGIELPFDKEYVTYVWFDALLNYTSAIGLKQQGRELEFQNKWAAAVHLIGKDILITHTVYWPTMLMALNLPLPRKIFAHGWWLTANNSKMSKSEGQVVKPLDMKDIVGVDGLRYFLTRDIHFGNDAQFSQDLVINRVNVELANNLGNLLSRTTQLLHKYFDGKIPERSSNLESSKEISKLALQTSTRVREDIYNYSPNMAVGHVVELLTKTNQCLDQEAPWKKAKENLAEAGETLLTVMEVLRISAILLHPVMPSKMNELLERIGFREKVTFEEAQKWFGLTTGSTVIKADPLFPRIQTENK